MRANRLMFCGLAVVVLLLPIIARAQDSSAWLGQGNPTLSAPDNFPAGQGMPQTVTGYGNTDCQDHKFITRPARLVPLQTEQSYTACAVSTGYGIVDPNGYIELNGVAVAGRLKTSNGNDSFVVPIPESNNAAVLQSTSNGFKLQFYENVGRSFSAVDVTPSGEVSYRLPAQPSKTLEDQSGKDFYVRPETITFSSNGNWLVVDSEFLSTLRVNLETYAAVPFHSPYIYHQGQNPFAQLAVSDDGRYAAVASRNADITVSDIATCGAVPAVITGPVSCQSKVLDPYLSQQIPGYPGVSQVRFINNNLISFITSYLTSSGTRQKAKYRLASSGTALEKQDYLALGDSFASGEGVYNYFSETDTSENMCHLSKDSYPYLIGRALQLSSYNSVACSGAKIEHINKIPQRSNIPSPNLLGNLLPGYKKQLAYVEQVNPNVVTVSVGGNDIGFGEIMKKCVGPLGVVSGTCFQSYEDRIEVVRLANKQFGRLTDLYKQIRLKNNVNVYVIGYPHIAHNDGNCAVNVRLDNEEIKFSNQLIDYLNEVVKQASNNSGVRYVDVSEAFADHKMCETSTNNVAVNGVTAGNDGPFGFGPIANEGFHPNKLGHQLYKAKILEQTNNFTLGMPSPDSLAKLPAETSGLPILNAIKTGRSTKETTPANDMAKDTIVANTNEEVKVSGLEYALKNNGSYRVELHSEPVNLGTFNANSSGDIDGNIVIPPATPPGFHTLHVYGQNINGEEIDLYKTIYVASSSNDFDGDGVANTNDSCLIVPNGFIDADKDVVDDICDEEITVPELSTDITESVGTVATNVDEHQTTNRPVAGENETSTTSHSNGQGVVSQQSLAELQRAHDTLPNPDKQTTEDVATTEQTAKIPTDKVLGETTRANVVSESINKREWLLWIISSLVIMGIMVMIYINKKKKLF